LSNPHLFYKILYKHVSTIKFAHMLIIYKSDLTSKHKQIYQVLSEFTAVEQVPHNFLQTSFAGPVPL